MSSGDLRDIRRVHADRHSGFGSHGVEPLETLLEFTLFEFPIGLSHPDTRAARPASPHN